MVKKDLLQWCDGYHRRNPQVYQEIKGIIRQMRARGYRRYSIQTALEIVRWEQSALEVDPHGEAYKINDWMKPYYARLLRKEEPFLGIGVEMRHSRMDWAIAMSPKYREKLWIQTPYQKDDKGKPTKLRVPIDEYIKSMSPGQLWLNNLKPPVGESLHDVD